MLRVWQGIIGFATVVVSLAAIVVVAAVGTIWTLVFGAVTLLALISRCVVPLPKHAYSETFYQEDLQSFRFRLCHYTVWALGYMPLTLVILTSATLQATLAGLNQPRFFRQQFKLAFFRMASEAYQKMLGWKGNKSNYTWGNYLMGMPPPAHVRNP